MIQKTFSTLTAEEGRIPMMHPQSTQPCITATTVVSGNLLLEFLSFVHEKLIFFMHSFSRIFNHLFIW